MDLAAYSGSSKQRRDLLKNETDQLGKELPFDYGKVSQLRILKAACSYLKKEKHFGKLRELSESSASSLAIDNLFSTEETLRNESFSGFVVCFTKLGELVHVSNTSYEHLGLRSLDILFNYENICDMVHEQDKHYFKDLDTNLDKYKNGATFSFYSLWFVSKIRRHEKSLTEYKLIQMSGHYDQKTDLYIATCKQILSVSNREILTGISADCFTSIHDSKLKFQEISLSVENLLGYNLDEDCFETKTLYELLAPESLKLIKERHLQILYEKDSKGYLDPVKVMHKNGYFVDCLVNLYSDMKDQIICKYQIIDSSSMQNYKQYVLNFKHNWSLYKFHESKTGQQSDTGIYQSEGNDSINAAQARQDDEFSNFISIDNSTSRKRSQSGLSESDASETSYEFSNSPKRSRIELIEEKSVDIKLEKFPVTEIMASNVNSIDEMTYFNIKEEEEVNVSCFDLNEIIEINNIKEDIEKELCRLQDGPSEKFSKFENYEKFDQINDTGPIMNYYNNQSNGFYMHQNEDEQLYESLLQDSDLFQCLQQAF